MHCLYENRPERAKAILRRLPLDVPIYGAEVGVGQGLLSAMLLRARPLLRLVMVDLWAHNPSLAYLATNDINALRLSQRRWQNIYRMAVRNTKAVGDRRTLLKMDSVAAAVTFDEPNLDFAFIDDDHSREGCDRSIRAWWPTIKPGGWLGGHDYGHPNPELSFAVTAAVTAFFSPLGLPVELDANFTWFVRKGTI